MKKQICFAGFGEVELAALEAFFASLGEAWDCVFSPDDASALTALAATRFDAVVANLVPSGIKDLELLKQIAIAHPQTLRLVLGDIADRQLIVNCLGVPHQFISRPWKPSELISVIERGLALDAWLANDNLRSFVPRLGKLPGLPATYFEVLKQAESPHSSVDTIADVIARDPTLTVRLLQMVNSAACGLAQRITSPTDAVSMLGLETVKSLVLCLQLFVQSAPRKAVGLSLDQLWRHSFSVAKLANRILLRCSSNECLIGNAYTAGLLHNIGRIVLATNLSWDYSQVVEAARKRKCSLQEVELDQLGVTSNQVGAYLLGVWGMPLPLLESTALYHAPASATSVEFSLLTIVHIANVLAQEENGPFDGLPLPTLDADYLGKLGLPKKTDAWRKLLAANPSTGCGSEYHTAARAAAWAPTKKERAGLVSTRLVVGGIAVAITLALVPRWRALRVDRASAPTPAVETQPPSATGRAKGTEASAGQSALDSITVQGIIYTAGEPLALINGKALKVGEHINGVQIVAIEPAGVVLAFKGQQKTFKLR